MNLYDPKFRFLRNAEVAAHHKKLCSDPDFMYCLDMAMLRYTQQLAIHSGPDKPTADAQHHKLVGAHEFITVLINLSEQPEIARKPEPSGLNYKA